MGYAHRREQGNRLYVRQPPGARTDDNQVNIGSKTVYATMQPTFALCCPSASMGVEWMGSDSEALEVTAKGVAKESIDSCLGVEVGVRCVC